MKRRALIFSAAGAAAAGIAGAAAMAARSREPGLPSGGWDLETEVLVIGGGAAGLSAALSAAEAGAEVLLIEKNDQLGGDTLIAGGYFNAPDPWNRDSRGTYDSVSLFASQIIRSGGGKNSPELARTLASEASGALAWLKGLGMRFLPKTVEILGSGFPRGHKPVLPRGEGYIRTLSSECLKKKVGVRTGCAASRLIMENSRVAGAVAVERGRPLRIRAEKGVILASGGYGASRELLRRFAPAVAELRTDSQPGATGEMIEEAEIIGASVVNLDQVECTPGSSRDDGLFFRLDLKPDKMIIVDARGHRFVEETAYRSVIAEAILKLKPRICWSVADSDTVASFDDITQKNLYKAMHAGAVQRADLPETLARKMKVPPLALRATMEKMAERRHLMTPPFWAAPVSLRVHTTLGGIAIDAKAHCLSKDGKPIPGLWAAGAATGNIHGANRLGGNGINTAVVFGRLAGAGAANS